MAELAAGRAEELAAMDTFAGCLPRTRSRRRPARHGAVVGQVLMHQGEPVVAFLLNSSGVAEIRHADTEGGHGRAGSPGRSPCCVTSRRSRR